MTAVLAAMGALQRPGRALVEPGRLLGGVTLQRAQIGTRSTVLGGDGATWTDLGANAARFSGASRRLLLEGQRTNAIRNPRGEGIAGGAAPTHAIALVAPGLTATYAAAGKVNGVDCWDVLISGTTSSTSGSFFFDSFPVLAGDVIRSQVFAQVVGGSTAAFSSINLRTVISGGSGSASSNLLSLGLDGTFRRFVPAAGVTAGAGATAAQVGISFGYASGAAINVTLRIGWPQSEIASFPSTPILPALGAPASSTRGADQLSATLASLGVGGNGACTVLGTVLLGQAAPAGAEQTILQIDGGSDTNRFLLRNPAGGTTLLAGDVLAGQATDAPALGSLTVGVPFRFGITMNGTGRIAGCLNAGTVQAATGGPASGLTTLRIGSNAAASAPAFMELAALQLVPFAVSDSGLRSLVAGLPG